MRYTGLKKGNMELLLMQWAFNLKKVGRGHHGPLKGVKGTSKPAVLRKSGEVNLEQRL
jgi:hypothetical protein